ncbi:MAG: hypothetical protein FWE35_20325, partial [Streptosporangiales bacterium]|nr:hypothetical protein [Streptosporangiales bacterium]
HRIVDVHGRFAGPVSLALALLASFTFISAAVVPLSTQLHSQLTLRLSQKEERLRAQEAGRARDYMQAVRQVTADLNAQVVAHVNIRVQESMPPSYKRMLSDTRFQNQVDRINSGTSQLGKTLHQIDPEAARVLAMENARTQNLQDLSDQLPESSPDGRLPTSAPAHVTASQAAAARKWVKEDSGEDVFDLLEADNDQITLQMGTTFISSPFWKNIKTAFKGKFPFAEPMIDILSSTIGDQLQETIYEKVAPIVKDVVNRTGNARAQISAVAQNISAKVNVASMVRAHAEEIINVTAEREADLTRLTDGATQVSYYAQIVREKNKLVLESVIDPIGLEFSPAGGDLITRGDFDPALTAILNSSEPVQAEVVKELASLSQASDSELLQLWQSYNMRVDSGALDTGDVDASGEPIVTDPVSLKHNAAHVLQFLAPDLPGVVTSGDLNIANANCGCS